MPNVPLGIAICYSAERTQPEQIFIGNLQTYFWPCKMNYIQPKQDSLTFLAYMTCV